MPCGPRARVTAYVTYTELTLADRSLLLEALAALGHTEVETAADSATLPLYDTRGQATGARVALAVRGRHLPPGTGDIGFARVDDAYVPVAARAAGDTVLRGLRGAYARAEATRLAEQARRRFLGSLQRADSADGTVTIRVRF
jgi:hypothetical protein